MTAVGQGTGRPLAVLAAACDRVGVDPAGAVPIRLGENAIFRLPGRGIVVRVARDSPDAAATAAKEVRVATWLATNGVPAIRAVDGIVSPVEVDGRVVTFWDELPDHDHGTYPHIAQALRRLHAQPIPPALGLPVLDPLAGAAGRIDAAVTVADDDRRWLHQRLDQLRARYPAELPSGLPLAVVHGDASAGNIVTTEAGPVLLDLERFSVGPPEWDLVATAIDHTTFGTLDADGYAEFSRVYGVDVTAWDGFDLLRDVSELRVSCWMARRAVEHPAARAEAELRIASLRGRNGPRPWGWSATL